MRNPLRSITQSLAKKLIAAVGIIIIGVGSISWYTLISNNRRNLMKDAVEYISSYSDLVKKSIRYNMLVFNRVPIQHTIEGIGSSEGIRNIRIFDSKGRIYYSSKKHEVGRFVDTTAFACAGCHTDPSGPSGTLRDRRKWTTQNKDGQSVITFVDPIYNELSCSTAACHVHSPDQKVLGILETDFSLSSLDRNIRRQAFHASLYAIALIVLSAMVIYLVLRRFVLKPIAAISGSMKRVAGGDLTQTIETSSTDEIGLLAGSFNVMTIDLKAAKEKVDNWTQELECEVAKKTEELKKSQNKLIQAEKLAAVGRLTSDVAHRIRNPLTSIGAFAHKLEKIAAGEKEREYAGIVATEVTRLEKILKDVLEFSGEARTRFEPRPIEEVVGDVGALYQRVCKEGSIEMHVNVPGDLPLVLMDANQAKQSLGKLVSNAIDAMPCGGSLEIRAAVEELNEIRYVVISVSDTGTGIAPDKFPLIFEPFFSTKDMHGSGLGLSIARKVMEEHGGFVKAFSAPGKGSVFSLYFPSPTGCDSKGPNCWEFMKCGRDNYSAARCAAFPNFGRICWAVAGTFCDGKAQGTFAQKRENCRDCEYYKKVEDEKS